MRNPPLLKEIVHILESNCTPIENNLCVQVLNAKKKESTKRNPSRQNESAISILNKLKNLDAIASGNYYSIPEDTHSATNNGKPYIEKIFYNECIFYLQKYGSHLSLLQFYVKHGEFHDALLYVVENQLNPEIFVEIYMLCLKSGVVNKLQENMSNIDCTLNLWKV